MKNKSLVLALAAFTLIALAVGCNKQETATPVAAAEQTKTPDQPTADVRNAAEAQKVADAQKAAEAVKAADAQKEAEAAAQKQAEADKAAQALKQEAADRLAAEKLAAEQVAAAKQSQLAPGGSKVQGLIDTAKSLAGEKKWTDVLKVLAQLAGEQLSPAQQTVVDGLKSDAQKQAGAAVADKAAADAGNALGGLLQPKK
jgi:hypothetical protein